MPTDWLFAATTAAGRHQSGSQIADAARDFAEWARFDPDIHTLSDGHANGGRSHHGGADDDDGGIISIATETQPETIVVVGKRNSSGSFDWYVHGTSGTGDAPVDGGDASLEPNEAETASVIIELIDACPAEHSAALTSLALLYNNSPTARALIDSMSANGTSLNLITANLSGYGQQNSFDAGNNQVLWDPFVYIEGTNLDGSSYTLAPVMVLAHELVHAGHAGDPAYQGLGSEGLVMQVANQIAAEMNAATGSNYGTNRTSHDGQRFNTTSPTSTTFSLTRPGCES